MSHPPRRTPLHPLVHLMVPTNLTVEVEGEIEVVEVKKHILRQFPDRVLGHLREDGVPKLVEAGRTASAKTNHRQHYKTFSNSWWQASAKIDFWICKSSFRQKIGPINWGLAFLRIVRTSQRTKIKPQSDGYDENWSFCQKETRRHFAQH